MPTVVPRNLLQFGLAIASVCAALLLRGALGSFVHVQDSPFLLGLGAVAVSAWFGGFGPGLFATLLAALATDFFFIEPVYSVFGQPDANLKLFVFMLEGVLISYLCGVIRRAESRNVSLMQTARDGMLTLDRSGRILEFNPAAEKMFGYNLAYARGRNLVELIAPERLRSQLKDSLRQCMSAGPGPATARRMELHALRADGTEFPAELSVTWIDADGPPHFSGIIRDITRRREIERELARQTQVAMLLQQASTLSAASGSFEKSLQACLDMVCKITGCPLGHIFLPDEQGRKLVSSRIWHLDSADAYSAMREVTESIRLAPGEGLPGRIWKSGQACWITNVLHDDNFTRAKLRPDLGVKGAMGFPVKIGKEVVAVMEFFSPKEMQPDPEILRLVAIVGDQLGRVIERRRNEEHARRGKDAAEAANRTKSEFLANVSHELRTPMNAVIGMLDLSLREDLTEVTRDYLQTARDSAEALLFLLNDILDFSRMEAGRFELEPAPFSLRETVDETMKTLSLRAHEKGLELASHVHRDVPDELFGDSRRLRQVLLNLTGNAIKFTERGEVVVDVTVEQLASRPKLWDDPSGSAVLFDLRKRRTPAGDQPAVALPPQSADEASVFDTAVTHVEQRIGDRDFDEVVLHITVSDTGIGIAPDDQARIFDAFTQVDASSTRRHTGSGLGLAISRELITRMGGRMWVESQLGRGSRFHCTAHFGLAAADLSVSQTGSDSGIEWRGLPVLVVDDNKTNRRILEDLLIGWELRPTSASDGRIALVLLQDALANGRPFPLVLVDALMPGMDGFSLIEQIRQDPRLNPDVILMLSSADRQTFQERSQGLGISGFLEKPVSQSDLLDAITNVLVGREPEKTNAVPLQKALRPLEVLLAEDTPANQKVVISILSRRGHKVSVANNGREAVDMVQKGNFDLVLMDVQMPVLDGLQATAAIRQLNDPAKAQIPIVAMTAHAMRGDRDRCLASGMDAYISKPVHADRLIRVIERLVAYLSLAADDASDRLESRETPSDIGSMDTLIWSRLQPGLLPAGSGQAGSLPGHELRIDRDAVVRRLGGDDLLFSNIVRFFDEDHPALLEAIRSGSPLGDREHVARAAHTLKGLVANFDAKSAMDAAMQIQELAERGDLAQVAPALAGLEREVARLSAALEPFRGAAHSDDLSLSGASTPSAAAN